MSTIYTQVCIVKGSFPRTVLGCECANLYSNYSLVSKEPKRRETVDEVVYEKSEVRIRTRKRSFREKISSFFKFWRPSSVSIYYLFFIFEFCVKRRFFLHVFFSPFRRLLPPDRLHTRDFTYACQKFFSGAELPHVHHTFRAVPLLHSHNYFLICHTGLRTMLPNVSIDDRKSEFAPYSICLFKFPFRLKLAFRNQAAASTSAARRVKDF